MLRLLRLDLRLRLPLLIRCCPLGLGHLKIPCYLLGLGHPLILLTLYFLSVLEFLWLQYCPLDLRLRLSLYFLWNRSVLYLHWLRLRLSGLEHLLIQYFLYYR